jgi:DNA primase
MPRLQPGNKLLKRRIDKVKESIDVPTVAQQFAREKGGSIQQMGKRWRGLCPLCGNGGRSNAFTAGERLWHCFACGEGGDVIRLVELYHDFPPAMAVTWLGYQFRIDLPDRPDSWYQKQDRQLKTRRDLVRARESVLRRRLYRIYMVPLLNATGATQSERDAAWEDFKNISVEGLVRVGEDAERNSRV